MTELLHTEGVQDQSTENAKRLLQHTPLGKERHKGWELVRHKNGGWSRTESFGKCRAGLFGAKLLERGFRTSRASRLLRLRIRFGLATVVLGGTTPPAWIDFILLRNTMHTGFMFNALKLVLSDLIFGSQCSSSTVFQLDVS